MDRCQQFHAVGRLEALDQIADSPYPLRHGFVAVCFDEYFSFGHGFGYRFNLGIHHAITQASYEMALHTVKHMTQRVRIGPVSVFLERQVQRFACFLQEVGEFLEFVFGQTVTERTVGLSRTENGRIKRRQGTSVPVLASITSTSTHPVSRNGRKAAASDEIKRKPATFAVAAIHTSLWSC